MRWIETRETALWKCTKKKALRSEIKYLVRLRIMSIEMVRTLILWRWRLMRSRLLSVRSSLKIQNKTLQQRMKSKKQISKK